MKNLLLLVFTIVLSTSIFAQNEIFISEYVEGSGNNKALELYNPTANPIVLQDVGYRLVRYSNGNGQWKPKYSVDITGTIPANGTWVAVIDRRNPNGSGNDTMADVALQALADTFLSADYNVNSTLSFNGNDAVTIELQNGTYVDIFGDIGVDPGICWTMDADAGYTSALGGRWWTANHTLIRKPSVAGGVTVNVSPFVVANEWDSLPNNTFTNLGSHTYIVGIEEVVKQNNAFFYPNPSTQGWFTVKGTEVINSVEVINSIGQSLTTIKNPVKRGDMRVSSENWTTGIYMVKINFADDSSIVKKVIIK